MTSVLPPQALGLARPSVHWRRIIDIRISSAVATIN
jgi:hypothetical protein